MITSIVELSKLLYNSFSKRIRYLKDMHDNSEILQTKKEALDIKLNDLVGEMQSILETEKIPTDEANTWLENARMLSDYALWLLKEAEHQGCFSIWCLHCCTSYQLGKEISRTTDWVDELINKIIDPIAVDPQSQRVLLFPTRAIKENTSAAATMEHILRYLGDEKTGKLGLWGRSGIGKSTILKNICNIFEGKSDFDAIILVEFKSDGSSTKLLTDIAAELFLDISKEENDGTLSLLLYQELKRMRFLLIVDDLSEVIDLQKLGVPDPSEQKGCKIVIASETREICSSMAADVEIRLDALPKDEAWELFRETVGYIPSNIDEVAQLVCDKCYGIAAVLINLGTALRNQPLSVWEKALSIVKSFEPQLVDPDELIAEIMKQASIEQEETTILPEFGTSNANGRSSVGYTEIFQNIRERRRHANGDDQKKSSKAKSSVLPKFGAWNEREGSSMGYKIFQNISDRRIHPAGNGHNKSSNGGCLLCCVHNGRMS